MQQGSTLAALCDLLCSTLFCKLSALSLCLLVCLTMSAAPEAAMYIGSQAILAADETVTCSQ